MWNQESSGSFAQFSLRGADYRAKGKLKSMHPEADLREVLSRIRDHAITRIEELLPWNVGASLPPVIEPAA
jgi:hypothetical protein